MCWYFSLGSVLASPSVWEADLYWMLQGRLLTHRRCQQAGGRCKCLLLTLDPVLLMFWSHGTGWTVRGYVLISGSALFGPYGSERSDNSFSTTSLWIAHLPSHSAKSAYPWTYVELLLALLLGRHLLTFVSKLARWQHIKIRKCGFDNI